jgi:hypothetical protein
MKFPLEVRFKTLALAPQVSVTDSGGALLLYVHQKAFKLKDSVTVYRDVEQTRPLYRINADRILDVSAHYAIEQEGGGPLGVLQRHGMRSLWRAHYELERGGAVMLTIREENPWVKVLDGLLSDIPLVGILSGYFLHPTYRVTRTADEPPVLRVIKQPALFERRYTIERPGGVLTEGDETLAVLAVLMMLLQERGRG